MNTLILWEYNWNGSKYAANSMSFEFDPQPRDFKKTTEIQWRISKLGKGTTGGRRLQKVKWRKAEKITYTISGIFQDASKRDELDFYARRNSLFKLEGCDLKTYETGLVWEEATEETVYVIIENATFTQQPGQEGVFHYTLDLTRAWNQDLLE